MDRAGVERWIDAYRQAWRTDAPVHIAALFTDDATYKPFPWRREAIGWQGRDEIVSKWIERGDSKLAWRFDHQVLAVDGGTAVVEGWTYYGRGDGQPSEEAYANIWVIDFATDGRAKRFREWWVQKPDEQPET